MKSDDDKPKPDRLRRYRPVDLDGPIAFVVSTTETNPYDAGPLSVSIDQEGIRIGWLGEDRFQWQATWTELRATIKNWREAEEDRAEAANELQTARELHADAERELAKARGEGVVIPMVPAGERRDG